MLGTGTDVVNLVLLQLLLEFRRAPPVDVLATVVRQQFLGHAVLSRGPAVDFKHVLGRLPVEELHSCDKPRVVIQVRDQVRLFAGQAKREDVALPHLIWRRPFEEPRLGRITFWLPLRFLDEVGFLQCPAYRLVACRQQRAPLEELGDSFHPVGGIELLKRDDLTLDRRGKTLRRLLLPLGPLEAFLSVVLVPSQPAVERALTHADLTQDRLNVDALLKVQLDCSQSLLKSVRVYLLFDGAAPRGRPRCRGVPMPSPS